MGRGIPFGNDHNVAAVKRALPSSLTCRAADAEGQRVLTPLSKGALIDVNEAVRPSGGILANGLISLPLFELALEVHPL